MKQSLLLNGKKYSREILRVRLDSFKGQAVICCRAWYRDSDGLLKPGKGGLTISVRHLAELSEAIGKAHAIAKQAGLLESERHA